MVLVDRKRIGDLIDLDIRVDLYPAPIGFYAVATGGPVDEMKLRLSF